VGGRNGIHLPIPAGPLTAEVLAVMANSTTKWNPDSRIFVKVAVDLWVFFRLESNSLERKSPILVGDNDGANLNMRRRRNCLFIDLRWETLVFDKLFAPPQRMPRGTS